jgi:hypothetical protein
VVNFKIPHRGYRFVEKQISHIYALLRATLQKCAAPDGAKNNMINKSYKALALTGHKIILLKTPKTIIAKPQKGRFAIK